MPSSRSENLIASCSIRQIRRAIRSAPRIRPPGRDGGSALSTSTTSMAKPRSRMSRSVSTNRWSSSGLNTTTSAPGGSAARGSRRKLAPLVHPPVSAESIESMIR